MIRIHQLALLLIIIVCSCHKIEEYGHQMTTKFFNKGIPIQGVTQQIESDLTCIEKNCAEIEVNYPIFKSHKLLNQRIESIVMREIEEFIPMPNNANTISDQMELFIKNYSLFKTQFPESETPWFLEINVETTYNRSGWLSFVSRSKSYTGGVRINESLKYVNTDTLGRTIDIEKKIGSFNELRRRAEIIFRNQNNLTPDSHLSASGYTFENNRFHLPKNIGINDTDILLYYNNYEIGDNSQGAMLIKIPHQLSNNIFELPDYQDLINYYQKFLSWWPDQTRNLSSIK